MNTYRVYFGSEKSVGVLVEDVPTEKEARIYAMDVLRENRQESRWSARQCVFWEDGKSTMTPPVSKFFGEFPKVVKVVEL